MSWLVCFQVFTGYRESLRCLTTRLVFRCLLNSRWRRGFTHEVSPFLWSCAFGRTTKSEADIDCQSLCGRDDKWQTSGKINSPTGTVITSNFESLFSSYFVCHFFLVYRCRSTAVLPVLWKLWAAPHRKLVVPGKLFLLENRSVVLFVIGILPFNLTINCTFLPCLFLVISFSYCWLSFLSDKGVVYSRKPGSASV